MNKIFSLKRDFTPKIIFPDSDLSLEENAAPQKRDNFRYSTPKTESQKSNKIIDISSLTIQTNNISGRKDSTPLIIYQALFGSTDSRSKSLERRKQQHSFLPKKQSQFNGMKTLVLDMDETLLHTSMSPTNKCDFVAKLKDGSQFYVTKRPHVDEFLERMSKLYEIVIYTAGEKEYSIAVIDELDPERYITYILHREHCLGSRSKVEKNLKLLGRDLQHVIFIDNLDENLRQHRENGIKISDFYSDKRDRELLRLIPFLEHAAQIDDVRPVNKNFLDFLAKEFQDSIKKKTLETGYSFIADVSLNVSTEADSPFKDRKSNPTHHNEKEHEYETNLLLNKVQSPQQNHPSVPLQDNFVALQQKNNRQILNTSFGNSLAQIKDGKPRNHPGDIVICTEQLLVSKDIDGANRNVVYNMKINKMKRYFK